MIWRSLWSNSIKNRLAFLFFTQLESNLTSQKLDSVKHASVTYTRPLQQTGAHDVLASQLKSLVRTISEKSGTRVTLFGIPVDQRAPEGVGDAPPYVISDSQEVETALDPSSSLVLGAARAGHLRTGTTAADGGALAQAARPIPYRGRPSWVVVYSEPLADVQDNVALIRRQILIAGVIALIVAIAVGYYAASVLARRVKRLERAAGEVAAGNFSRPIPVDSDDELGQLAVAFNEMQRRLARLDKARKEFIANASHELRTPIFSLGGFVELLQDEDLDEQTRVEFLETMRGQVDRLQKLATDLLDLSRLDAGSLELEREPVSLRALARQITHEFAAAAARSNVTLVVDDPEDAPEVEALSDGQRVAQILRILVDNGLTHTPPGTQIRVRTGVEGAAESGPKERGTAFLEVEDDGGGIKRRDLPHIFERFQTGNTGGSGLGLAIARELAQGMRGQLEASSRPGQTVFRLTLPLAGEQPPRPPAEAREVAIAAPKASV
jgi:two-component system OmpR family sensor kinase